MKFDMSLQSVCGFFYDVIHLSFNLYIWIAQYGNIYIYIYITAYYKDIYVSLHTLDII